MLGQWTWWGRIHPTLEVEHSIPLITRGFQMAHHECPHDLGIAAQRIQSLVDEGSFIETEAYVRHRSTLGTMNLNRPRRGRGRDGARPDRRKAGHPDRAGAWGLRREHGGDARQEDRIDDRPRQPDDAPDHRHMGRHGPACGGRGPRARGDGRDARLLAACSGRIPIISVILGTVAGTSALAAGLSDFVILEAEHGRMFMRSPWLIPEISSGELDEGELGGAGAHSSRSGVACLVADGDQHAFELAMDVLSYLPDNTESVPPRLIGTDDPMRACDDLDDIVPSDTNKPYDMRKVVQSVVDDGGFLELPDYAENIITGFASWVARPSGSLGTSPACWRGAWTSTPPSRRRGSSGPVTSSTCHW